MTKFTLRFKSLSSSTPTSSSPSPVDDASVDGDPPTEPQDRESKKLHRTPNKYLANLRENRFFTLRKRRSRKEERNGSGLLQVDRIPTPKSLPGIGRTKFMTTGTRTPKTPQITSLFSSSSPVVRSESHRHHRQYAVSLSNFPQIRNMMMDHGRSNPTTLDPESPSITRLMRLNSQKQRVASAPVKLGDIVPTGSDDSEPGTAAVGSSRGGLILLEQGTDSSASQSIIPIPSLILQTPTSGSGGGTRESHNSTVSSPGPDNPSPAFIVPADNFSCPYTKQKNTDTTLQRSLTILQQVAKRIQAEQEYSQSSLFWFLILPTLIMVGMAMLVFSPNTLWDSNLLSPGINNMNASLFIPCIVGVAVAACLRCALWILASFFHSFCEMDLEPFFNKNGIQVDHDGTRVGQADIVSGIFG